MNKISVIFVCQLAECAPELAEIDVCGRANLPRVYGWAFGGKFAA